ncbi:zinc-finger-containing protein [Paraburkholderia sp. 2C]
MRVGRPVKALPQPHCDYCGARAQLAQFGDADYPYRDDHAAVWICTSCAAWIGVRPRSKHNVPLGRLADAPLREAKSRLHDRLEPLAEAKARRDKVSVFEARAKAVRWVAQELGFDPVPSSLHAFTLDQCEQALRYVEAWKAHRNAGERQ